MAAQENTLIRDARFNRSMYMMALLSIMLTTDRLTLTIQMNRMFFLIRNGDNGGAIAHTYNGPMISAHTSTKLIFKNNR